MIYLSVVYPIFMGYKAFLCNLEKLVMDAALMNAASILRRYKQKKGRRRCTVQEGKVDILRPAVLRFQFRSGGIEPHSWSIYPAILIRIAHDSRYGKRVAGLDIADGNCPQPGLDLQHSILQSCRGCRRSWWVAV